MILKFLCQRSLFVTPVFPKFKHPHLLQSLRFSGIIRDEYFHGIFQQPAVNHLHQLQMNHSSLSMLEATSLQGYVFEALEFIEIMADFTYIFRNIDDSRILTNVLSILRNQFPSLRTCNVYIPYNAGREIEITKTFFRFLHCVSRTLRCMEMFYFFMLSDEMEEDLDETTTTDDVDDPELDEITQVASGSLRLEIAMLHMNIDHLRCFSYWTRLLSQQRQLEYLVVLSEHQIFTPSLIRQISNNLRIILVNIDTRGTDGRATPLDCEIFQDCHHLSHFSIKGRFEDFILLFSTPGLVNVNFLPMSITHIDLSRIPVRSNDLHRVLLYMENLRHFTAKFVGRHGEMGATMDTLREVILRRRLHWLHLVGSINGEFPSGGLSNGHPSRPIALYMDEDAFCVKLNRTGYYGYASAFEELQASVLGRNR